jgi:very-short-patch-repair endonuclease
MTDWHISTVQQMRRRGWNRESLHDAVQIGRLHRVRRGYYCSPDAPRDLVRAVRVGGQATGPTALPHFGVWTPPDPRLHVLVPSDSTRLRQPEHRFKRLNGEAPVHVHWQGGSPNKPTLLAFRPFADVRQALIDTVRCCPPDFAAGAIDSALHLRRISAGDLAVIREMLPSHLQVALAHPTPEADSGFESVVIFRLRSAGLRVEAQVYIRGVGKVDVLVDGRLVLELDGREFHDNASQFAEDRRRDLELASQHLRSLRVTYSQGMFDWPRVLTAVRAALAG